MGKVCCCVFSTRSVRPVLTEYVKGGCMVAAHAVSSGDDAHVESCVVRRHPRHRQSTRVVAAAAATTAAPSRGGDGGATAAGLQRRAGGQQQGVALAVVRERDRGRVESTGLGRRHSLQPLTPRYDTPNPHLHLLRLR